MNALIQVILRGFESKDIDYKGPMTWDERDNRKGCCEVINSNSRRATNPSNHHDILVAFS
jgi:hypothetical protein